jgi:uncharacterized protein (TIGR02722 family)
MTGRVKLGLAAVSAAAVLVGGCADGNERITRVADDAIVDVSYRYNDTDARKQAAELMNDALSKPWIENWRAGNAGALPKVVLGNVKNKTSDFNISSEMVTDQVQRELVNSGRVRVFAARDIRNELRAERFDTEFADPATVKKAASEIKADFMIVGNLSEAKAQSNDGRSVVVNYIMTLEITDMATTEKVWIGRAESKKVSQR